MVDTQSLINILFGLVGVLGGWWMNNFKDVLKGLQQSDKELADKVSAIEVLVAGRYVTREEMNQSISTIFLKLDNIYAKLSTKADR